MKALVHYEIKKIWKRKSTGVVFLLMLLSIIAISLIFVSDQGYYGKDGAELRGFEAISEKRSVERASVDPLDSQRLQIILQNYKAAYADQANYDSTTGFLRNDVYVENVLPYREILNLIRGVYTPDVYDLSALAALSDEQTGDFYTTRQSNIQGILASGNYTAAEKEKVMELDSQITTPFEFDYSNGWKTLLTRAFSFLFVLIALATCIMISPIFSYEYQIGTDAILLPTRYGRYATVRAKLVAAWFTTSIVYLVSVLFGIGIIIAIFGAQGWNCNFQILALNSFYDVRVWQVVLYGVVINYVVILSVMSFTMLLSAVCKTAFAAVIISTLCTAAPLFFPTGQSNAMMNHLVNLLPAKAVMTYSVFSSYDVYSIGKLVITLPYMILLAAVVFGILELQIARRQYCRHQVV